uniref:Heterogeneous nuclear ribonucleoprotein U-like protein 1 n=1 Tax=Anthurium amnicola TaxID=1678845 RepID=A0A1D1ZDK4_9ARAE
MATTAAKQHRPAPAAAEREPEAKRARPSGPSGSAGAHPRVVLNPADCDLDFDVAGNGLEGHSLHGEGFAYCWSGARATVGITGGKYYFGCQIISEQKVQMEDTAPDQQHLCRLGISRGDDPVGNLGESGHSFGFGGTGKFSTAGKFSDYGAKFGVGDTIICAVNLEDQPLASIGYSLNGKWLGNARQFDAGPRGLGVLNSSSSKLPWQSALFPHVLLKNVVVQMQFCIEDGLVPEEGYKPWSSALEDGHAVVGSSFSSPKECEVMMMVGLPASGKTTWAEKWVKDHPEKRYVLLGTNLALDQMKVPGLLRKQNYGERFDCLMERATKIFNTLLSRASKTPRNYIIDQTNVYKSARKRKLQAFVNFRKVAVVIFPMPDELKFRADKRFKEMGKEVPAEAVNEMLAHYVLPVSRDMPRADELFDQVMFPELGRGEAQRHLEEMKRALRSPSNLSGRATFSPYSRESSVQLFNSPSSVTNRVFPASGGHRQASNLPPPSPIDNPRTPVQVNSLYYGSPGLSSGAYQISSPNQPMPYSSPSGNYPTYGAPIRDDPYSYRSSGGVSPYDRRSIRSSIPFGDTDPYARYTGTEKDSYGKPIVDVPGSVDRPIYGDRRTFVPPLGSSTHSGETIPHADYLGRGETPFGQQSYFVGTSAREHLEDFRSPEVEKDPPFERPDHLPPTYGSPCAGPGRNPAYGSFTPPERQPPERYPPSGSWYR